MPYAFIIEMNSLEPIGKILLVAGIILAILGIVFILGHKIPILGKLPGDFVIQKGNFRIVLPLASSLVASIILTIVLNIVIRLFNK